MRTFWQNLNERERWILAVGMVCFCSYLFYILIDAPLSRAVTSRTQQLIEKKETLLWMQQVQKLKGSKAAQHRLNQAELLTVLASQLRQSSFSQFPYQLQQTAAGEVLLTFEQVPFNLIVIWLQSLARQYALSIRQLTAERTEAPGVTKVSMIFSVR